MKKIIIITTINLPLNLYEFKKLDKKSEWDYLVVGDLKTNHEAVKEICKDVGGLYLSPLDQMKLGFTHSAAIGWNCIERKNIGYLFALKENYDLFASLDDDNFPNENWFKKITIGMSKEKVYSSNNGWLNAADWANVPYKLRGYPIHLFHDKYVLKETIEEVNIGIQSGLVLGDPDTDAITRIVNKPDIKSYSNLDFCLAKGTMSPYNTQNTIIKRELIPANMMWGDCGRYNDIFASYVGQKIAWKYGYVVKFGNPLVEQKRNEHDLINDLEQELLGMRIQKSFLQNLEKAELKGNTPIENLKNLIYELVDKISFLPKSLKTQIDTWYNDIVSILGKIQ
jgi:hypothetical protein